MGDVSMNLGLMLVAAAAAFSSFPLTAQPADTTTRTGVSASAGNRPVDPSSKTDAGGAVELSLVSGELQDKLDSKTAKVGDSVVVMTKAAVQTADGTEIPKGAMLAGAGNPCSGAWCGQCGFAGGAPAGGAPVLTARS
jgi:hypothetical protein